MPRRCTRGRWRYEKNHLVPIIPMWQCRSDNLAGLYKTQERYADAEPLYKRSLAIWKKALGPNSPNVATSLNNLANLYQAQGRYADAETLYKQSLAIGEKVFAPDHPDVARSLSNLVAVYHDQSRYADAEPLFKRSLAIREKARGSRPSRCRVFTEQSRRSLSCPNSLCRCPTDRAEDHLSKYSQKASCFRHSARLTIRKISFHRSRHWDASYAVLQRSISSAAGEAVSKLASRFAAGTDELSRFVREDQDLAAEADRLGQKHY